MGLNWGLPSNCGGENFASLILTVAVCGTLLAISASWACAVPGTDALMFFLSLSSGILAKSVGRFLPSTKLQGPSFELALNQRPEILI
jgi:hypothetical protein